MAQTVRRDFGKNEGNLPELDLSLVQRESWGGFLENGIARQIAEITPISDFTGKNWELHLGETFLGDPTVSVRRASEKGVTHSSPLKISATLVNLKTGKKTTQEVFLGDIPQMTRRGTFIINGIERTVINQLVISPGAYFSGELDRSSGRLLHKAEMRPLHGSWLEFEVGKNDVIAARIDRRRKVVATAFLRALGIETDSEILAIFKEADKDESLNYITATL